MIDARPTIPRRNTSRVLKQSSTLVAIRTGAYGELVIGSEYI